MVKEFNTLAELMIAFADPQAAIDHFSSIRWRNGIFCPYCKHTKAYTIKERNRYKCASMACTSKFSVTVGTIFENTKLPLRIWFGAMWLIANHKKGVASTTLAVDLGITQKTAWFLLHRLRHTAKSKSFNAPLSGEVEVDETFIGGKGTQGHGPKGKSVVIGAVERGGKVVASVSRAARQSHGGKC